MSAQKIEIINAKAQKGDDKMQKGGEEWFFSKDGSTGVKKINEETKSDVGIEYQKLMAEKTRINEEKLLKLGLLEAKCAMSVIVVE